MDTRPDAESNIIPATTMTTLTTPQFLILPMPRLTPPPPGLSAPSTSAMEIASALASLVHSGQLQSPTVSLDVPTFYTPTADIEPRPSTSAASYSLSSHMDRSGSA
jgi:hypothetical protein